MTVVSLISDVMLACTVIYFHTMPQKVAGGAIAIGTWFFMYRWDLNYVFLLFLNTLLFYRFWFQKDGSPGLPGSGLFKYQHLSERLDKQTSTKRTSSINKDLKENPLFMGMPIYKDPKDRRRDTNNDEGQGEETESKFAPKERSFFSDADVKLKNVKR